MLVEIDQARYNVLMKAALIWHGYEISALMRDDSPDAEFFHPEVDESRELRDWLRSLAK